MRALTMTGLGTGLGLAIMLAACGSQPAEPVAANTTAAAPAETGYIAKVLALPPRQLNGVLYRDRKSTRLNSSHIQKSRMPSSA